MVGTTSTVEVLIILITGVRSSNTISWQDIYLNLSFCVIGNYFHGWSSYNSYYWGKIIKYKIMTGHISEFFILTHINHFWFYFPVFQTSFVLVTYLQHNESIFPITVFCIQKGELRNLYIIQITRNIIQDWRWIQKLSPILTRIPHLIVLFSCLCDKHCNKVSSNGWRN